MSNMLVNLTAKQKFITLVSTTILILLLLIILVIYPIIKKNNALNKQIVLQQELHTYLLDSQKLLQNNKIFPNLEDNVAKNIINKVFAGVSISTTVKDSTIAASIKNQNFSKIINAIYSLKRNNGIVVINAQITKVKSGLVDATLVFKYP